MKKQLLAAFAATTLTLSVPMPSAQAQDESVPRDQRFGRAVPAKAYINREVVNQAGKNVGQVEDVIFDVESGRVLYVALNPKGGAQGDMVAVPPRLFALPQPQPDGAAKTRRPLIIRANEQALAGAPKFAGTGEELSQGAYANKVYTHFNQPRWWEGAAGADAGKFNHIRRASNASKFVVENVSNEKLGQIETILFDIPAGRVSYFILDPAESVVNKQQLIPLPPMAFTRGQENHTLVLDADKEKLNKAPRIDRDDLTAEDIQKLSNPAFATKVYNYYGKQPWFQNEGIPSPTGRTQNNN